MNKQDRTQQRLRRWAAPLYEDSRLRDQLNDTQAAALLAWAEARLRQTAARTAHLPDEDAAPVLEKEATAVQLILRGANDLLARTGAPPDYDIIDDVLTRLLKNLRWLTETPLSGAQKEQLRRFKRAQQTGEREAAFHHLLGLIRGED